MRIFRVFFADFFFLSKNWFHNTQIQKKSKIQVCQVGSISVSVFFSLFADNIFSSLSRPFCQLLMRWLPIWRQYCIGYHHCLHLPYLQRFVLLIDYACYVLPIKRSTRTAHIADNIQNFVGCMAAGWVHAGSLDLVAGAGLKVDQLSLRVPSFVDRFIIFQKLFSCL